MVDKPLIQYAVEEAKAAGIEEFIFVTGRGKTAIEDHFDHSFELAQLLADRGKTKEAESITVGMPGPGQVAYTRQQKPLGLGHAVWCARNLVGDEPFAVLLADDIILTDDSDEANGLSATSCLRQLIDAYDKIGGNLVAVMDVPREHTERYGVLDVAGEDGRLFPVKGLVEKPSPEKAPSTLAIIGRYILQPAIFKHLERQERGAGDEIQLTDAMARMIGDQPFHGLRFEGTRYDCGDKVGYLAANIAFALRRDDLRDAVREAVGDILARDA